MAPGVLLAEEAVDRLRVAEFPLPDAGGFVTWGSRDEDRGECGGDCSEGSRGDPNEPRLARLVAVCGASRGRERDAGRNPARAEPLVHPKIAEKVGALTGATIFLVAFSVQRRRARLKRIEMVAEVAKEVADDED